MNKIIKKPWGTEEILTKNTSYLFKKLYMKKNQRCSLQLHKKKIETIYVLSGLLEVQINKKFHILKKGNTIIINNNVIHRMKALRDNTYYLEASSPHFTDVVRIEDDYRRL